MLLKWLKSAFTDENGDIDGILACILFACILGCVLTGYEVLKKGKDFDFEKFGNGVAYIVGAGGVGYGVKRLGEKHGSAETSPNVPQS